VGQGETNPNVKATKDNGGPRRGLLVNCSWGGVKGNSPHQRAKGTGWSKEGRCIMGSGKGQKEDRNRGPSNPSAKKKKKKKL